MAVVRDIDSGIQMQALDVVRASIPNPWAWAEQDRPWNQVPLGTLVDDVDDLGIVTRPTFSPRGKAHRNLQSAP